MLFSRMFSASLGTSDLVPMTLPSLYIYCINHTFLPEGEHQEHRWPWTKAGNWRCSRSSVHSVARAEVSGEGTFVRVWGGGDGRGMSKEAGERVFLSVYRELWKYEAHLRLRVSRGG